MWKILFVKYKQVLEREHNLVIFQCFTADHFYFLSQE